MSERCVAHENLRTGVTELRAALRTMRAYLKEEQTSSAGVRDLGTAVDGLRGSIWGMLQDAHEDDRHDYLATLRVRRATEICDQLLEDLHTGVLRPDLEGYEMLRASLRDLHAVAAKETT